MGSKLHFDRNATGTGSGLNWLNAKSDPTWLMNNQLRQDSLDQEVAFAYGDNPWPFSIPKTEVSGPGRLWVHSEDPGNGSRQKPKVAQCLEPHPALTGWFRIQSGPALTSATPDGTGTSNLWYTTQEPTRWSGAFRGADGKVFFGRRTKMKDSDAQYSGAPPNVPDTDFQYGFPSYGGTVMYLSLGSPQTWASMLRRPSGFGNETKVWTFDKPLGGLELAGLEASESDFAINVSNGQAGSLIDGVAVRDCDFFYSRKGFTLIGTGTRYQRVGAGFRGFRFERNRGFKLGQMLFHATGSPAMDDAIIRANLCRYNNMNEGSGAFYLDSAYTTNGSWVQVLMNWVDQALYDGRYWLDGSAFYSEFGSANIEYLLNLVTNSDVALHLNIGTGHQRAHHNVFRGPTVGPNSEGAIRVVTANLDVYPTDMGDAHIWANLIDRFGMMLAIIELNWWDGTGDRTRVYVSRNIARGRKSLDSNTLYPIQGNNGIFDNGRLWGHKNNFTDFNGSTISATEYGTAANPSPNQFADALYATTRVSDTAVMANIPVPADATSIEVNYALEAPTDIGTLNGTTTALRAGKPALCVA